MNHKVLKERKIGVGCWCGVGFTILGYLLATKLELSHSSEEARSFPIGIPKPELENQ